MAASSSMMSNCLNNAGKVAEGDWIVGAGPVILLPTAFDEAMGTKKMGAWLYRCALNETWNL